MKKTLIAALSLLIVVAIIFTLYSTSYIEDIFNQKPTIKITYPPNGATVASIVMISGTASDPDDNDSVLSVEIQINDQGWFNTTNPEQWSYDWNTYQYPDGEYRIHARSWDGETYSDIYTITVLVDNPQAVASDAHRWAVFIATANFPNDNESKLGNGGLFLAEEMAAFLIEKKGYPTENIVILFDDGWIRKDNGYGERIETLQQRRHTYAITYGGATQQNVENVFLHLINQSNQFRDSEVFIWIFNHGYGDLDNSITGGKLFESSQIFLWDAMLSDKDLGSLLSQLRSLKTCILIDACYCGGFADKTILDFSTSLLFRSGLPRAGRVVITGTSKFRVGYASTTDGPLFTQLWFDGIKTGKADGYKPGLLSIGRPTLLNLFKDKKVSVEEAFYYARHQLRTNPDLRDYNDMQPQINDKYPFRGRILSRKGLILGES